MSSDQLCQNSNWKREMGAECSRRGKLNTYVPLCAVLSLILSLLPMPCRLFSMMTEEVTAYLETLNKQQVLLCGLEAHVCVLQTAMDLIEQGKEVHLICDAVSSQRPHDRAVAMERLKDIGVHFTTAESVMFQLLKTAAHPQFKACSKLLKGANVEENNFKDHREL
jgi:hypothetical protein